MGRYATAGIGYRNSKPVFLEFARLNVRGRRCRRLGGVRLPGDKHDFELSSMEVVPDDNLVAVSFQGGSGFGDEKLVVRFKLCDSLVSELESRRMLLTLKETMYPSLVHSSTRGLRILGTWSISI